MLNHAESTTSSTDQQLPSTPPLAGQPSIPLEQSKEQSIESAQKQKPARRSLSTMLRRCPDCKGKMELRSLQHEKRRCDDCQRKREKKLAQQRYQRMKRENPEAWAKLRKDVSAKNASNAPKRKATYVPHSVTPERQSEICLHATAVRDALRDKQIPRWNGESDPNTVIANPGYEKDAGIIKNFVICRIRECGKQVSSIAGHLGKNVHPENDLAKYRRDHPGAPIYSLRIMKRNRDFHRRHLKAKPEKYAGYRTKRKDRLRREQAELAELRAKATDPKIENLMKQAELAIAERDRLLPKPALYRSKVAAAEQHAAMLFSHPDIKKNLDLLFSEEWVRSHARDFPEINYARHARLKHRKNLARWTAIYLVAEEHGASEETIRGACKDMRSLS
jgi:hypothetical protein